MDRSPDKKGGHLRRDPRVSMSQLGTGLSYSPPGTAFPLLLKLQCNPVPQPDPSCLLGFTYVLSCASGGAAKRRRMLASSEAKMV